MIGIEGVPEPGQEINVFEESLVLPVPGPEKNTILFEERDGSNIQRLAASAVDFKISGKTAFKVRDVKIDVFITDARVAFACSKYDKGGGWFGGVSAIALNAGSKALAAIRRHGKMMVGQVRYAWIGSVGSTAKEGWGSDERLIITGSLAKERPYRLTLLLPKNVSGAQAAAEIARRTAAYRISIDETLTDEKREAIAAFTQAEPLSSPGKNKIAFHSFPTFFFVNAQTARWTPGGETHREKAHEHA